MEDVTLDVSMRQLCTRAGAWEAARNRVLCDGLKITVIRKSNLYPNLTLYQLSDLE